MRTIRRIWRAVRILVALVVHPAYTALAARRLPPAERSAFRARRQQIGMAVLCRTLGIRVTMTGTPPAHRPMLYVCNHLGLLDTLVLASQMPVSFAAKAEIRAWPLLGWVCSTMGVLFVERERPTQTSRFVRDVQQKLGEGVPVLVFPEGTTGPGDALLPFKTGAFESVAGQEQGAVLPLHLAARAIEGDPARRDEVVWGTQGFLEHGWHVVGLRRVDMHVRVGEPVATAGHDRKQLARLTQQAVGQLGALPVAEPA